MFEKLTAWALRSPGLALMVIVIGVAVGK